MEDLEAAIHNNNIFYIHLNHFNVGDNERTINWAKFRGLSKATVLKNYTALFSSKISNGEEILETLGKTMELKQPQLISKIDKGLKEKLQNEVNSEKLGELYERTRGLKEIVSNCIKKGERQTEPLREALKKIGNSLKLLEDDSNDSLGAVLLDISERASSKSIRTGAAIRLALNEYGKVNNCKGIKKQSLEKSIHLLQNFSYALQHKKFKTTGKTLTSDGLSKLVLNNIVSTAIAQGLGFIIGAEANKLITEANVKAFGTKMVQSTTRNTPITAKTDILIENAKYHVKGTNKEIEISIGISSKFYTGKAFKNQHLENSMPNVSSGTSGLLSEAINDIFGKDIYEKYLVYNYYTHEEYFKDEVKKMRDLILKRRFLQFFSSAGNEDFSHFILVNGKIVSIWQLLQYVVNTKFFEVKRGQNIVTLNLRNKEGIKKANNKINPDKEKDIKAAWERSKNVNKAFNEVELKAELHLANLLKYLKNNNENKN